MRVGRFGVVLGCVLVSATALAATASAAPAPGELDPSFGVAGIVTGDNYVTEGWATMAVGPEDETFVLAPNAANCQPTELCKTVTLNLARYGRDGARDPIFGGASQLVVRQNQYQHSALAVGPEGKPVVAALDERSVLVARFGRDGLLDPGFGSGGIANASLTETRGTAPIVAVQADGRVLVAYEASEGSATEGRLVLTRFLANGNPDLSFGKGGTVTVTAALTRPAGLAFRGGGGFDVGLSQCCRGEGGSALTVGVDRFLPDGSLDPSLTSGGQGLVPRGTPSLLEAIAAAQGGRVYIAVNEERRGAMLLRLLPNGAPDPGFGKGGEVHLGVVVGVSTNVSQIAADSAGRVVGVAGYYGGGSNIFRLRSNGAPDLTFGAGRAVRLPAAGTNVSSTGFGFQSSGRIVMIVESGGSGVRAYKLARLFAGDSRVRCLGKRATIVGTAAAEKIVGTPGRDVIAALGGADQVRALGGNDLICGGKGRDSLFGGGGRDKIRQ